MRHVGAVLSLVARMERSEIREQSVRGKTVPGFRFAPSGLRFWLRRETERHAAELKRISRRRATFRFCGIEHFGDVGDLECQPAHDVACAFNKGKTAIGELQLR